MLAAETRDNKLPVNAPGVVFSDNSCWTAFNTAVDKMMKYATDSGVNRPNRDKYDPITSNIVKRILDSCDDTPLGVERRFITLFLVRTNIRGRSELRNCVLGGFTHKPSKNGVVGKWV